MPDTYQQQKDAESDAKWLALLLLLVRNGRVEFRRDVGRFYIDGKSVSITTIRGYLNRIERRMSRELLKLVDDLAAGRITAAEWGKEFRRSVTSAHILAGALALGGITKAIESAAVQKRHASELKYADRFGKQIARGKAGTFKAIAARAKSYLMAATITYGIIEHAARKLIYTEAIRHRRASESCPGCVQYSGRWMPINEMPPIGSLQCGGHCRCYLEYR